MFMLESTHRRELGAISAQLYLKKVAYDTLLEQWNALVKKINAHGGDAIFRRPSDPLRLDKTDIQRLLLLCHPDKHDGKLLAVEMTQKLLALRK